MSRATAAEQAARLNHAREVLAHVEHLPDAVDRMVRDCGLSPRQAYRYLRHARRLRAPVAVPEPRVALTVKLSRTLAQRLRHYATAHGLTLSEIVSRAVMVLVQRGPRRG